MSDYLLPYPILLGRDFLCAFNIGLSMYHLIPNSVVKPEIILNVDSDLNKIMVSNNVLHCVFGLVGDKSSVMNTCNLCQSVLVECCGSSEVCDDDSGSDMDDLLPHI